MKMEKSTKIKIIFITIFFISTFTAEFFYRDPLFERAIPIAKAIQNKVSSFWVGFFQIYTRSTKYDYVIIGIILYFFPINYSYTFFLELMIGEHVCNFIKLAYGNGRPYLQDKKEAKDIFIDCSSSYGNPSGHSFRSSSTFLSVAQCIIDFFELGYLPSIFIYIFIGIVVLSINFSRVLLGVHSFDQVIFGDTLGFTNYFIIFQIIKPHKRDIDQFYNKFLDIKYHVISAIAFVVVLTYTSIGAYIFERENDPEIIELREKLKEKCTFAKDNGILAYDSAYKSFFFMGYFGMICGITCLTFIVYRYFNSNYEALNNYYKNSNYNWYITYPLKLVFLLICYIPFCVTKYKPVEVDMILLYIFGSSVPIFLFGFMLFGPRYIFYILSKLANKELYKLKLTNEETIDYILGEE